MLKISPYIPLIIPVIAIGGIFYPKLGYFMLLDMILLMTISPFRGRWFCSHLCSRGLFSDIYLRKISRNRKIPKFFKSYWIRIPILVLMMGMFIVRIINTQGIIDRIGIVMVAMYIQTTLIVILMGLTINPRSFCTLCPMGTIQRWFGGKKKQLNVDMDKCVKCKVCHKACPMQLPVNEILHKPDCIKCGKCITVCPKGALSW